MGGNPSKKSNFQDCSLTQEQIDKIYSNFCEFSKLKDGKSGSYISSKGLQKVIKPNKELGKKIHQFLSEQSVSQSLTFDTFLYFVEFFLQGTTYIRQDIRYRDYSIVEMFGLLSFYSSLTKNKQADKEYISRLKINYRMGLEFFIEIHGIIGALNGKYKWDRDETIPKKHNSFIFGDKYEMSFSEFIVAVTTKHTNLSKILLTYFQNTFYHGKQYKENQEDSSKRPPKQSALLDHNALTNLALNVNLFSEFPHREIIYDGQKDRYNFESLTKAIQTFGNQNLLLIVSHQVTKQQVVEDDEHILSRSKWQLGANTERQSFAVFLPKYKNQSESFLQLTPNFQVYPNSSGRQNFFNMDSTAIVVFFGDEENDLMFLHNEIDKQSYIKSAKPEFAQSGDQPLVMKIDQIELWVLSDETIDMSLYNKTVNTTVVIKEEVVTPQPQVNTQTITTTTTSNVQPQSVVIERNVSREYYVTQTNQQYYQTTQIKDVK
ncbi:hypothetical protein ABPG74_006859 [Tetrahymena malaccensis]